MAAAVSPRSGSELERQLLTDAADGRLDRFSLFTAALIASGTSDANHLERYEARYADTLKALRQSDPGDTPERRAQAVLTFLHRQVLRGGYDATCTDLRRVLDEGRYNCVSATVLFECLAGDSGLSVATLAMPAHVMSRVRLSDGPCDVEATRIDGLRRGHSRNDAREATRVQLLAMIYYNRGLDLLAEKRFAEAAAANTTAMMLDPASTVARGNLLATLNNWAVDLAAQDRFAEAIALIEQGMAIDPAYQPFTLNHRHVHQRWTEQAAARSVR